MSAPIKDLGPCRLIYNSVDLGLTSGGVKFKDEVKSKDILADQHGETPIDAVLTGRAVEIEAPLLQSSLAILEDVIAGAVVTGTSMEVSNSIGGTMYANAHELIIKPAVDSVASATTTEWLHILKAYPVAKLDFGYDANGVRVFKVTFKAFPDQTSGQVGLMWRIGPAV